MFRGAGPLQGSRKLPLASFAMRPRARALALVLWALVHVSLGAGGAEAVTGAVTRTTSWRWPTAARGRAHSVRTGGVGAAISVAPGLRRGSGVRMAVQGLPSEKEQLSSEKEQLPLEREQVPLEVVALHAGGAGVASASRGTARAVAARTIREQPPADLEVADANETVASRRLGAEDEATAGGRDPLRSDPLNEEECRVLRMGGNSTGSGDSAGRGKAGGGREREPGQCWSRNEWRCFSRLGPSAGLNAPSPTLRRLLRRYRRHWRWCNSEETPYRALELLKSGKPTVCKYIMVTPMEMGLGNHALSVLSAFTYALLTSRILFLEPRNNPIPDLFCEPFQDTPSWSLQHTHMLGGPEKRAAPPLTYVVRLNEKVNLSRPAPVVLQFHTHHRVHMQRFFCERFHRWAQNSSVLLSSSNMWWVPSLMFVPHLRARLQRLFPTHRVFSTLAPLILHPNNRVWRTVTSLLQAQRLDSIPRLRPMVGIQYRDDSGLSLREGLDSIGHCISRLFPDVAQSFSSPHPQSVSAYLASLNAEFRGAFSAHMRRFRVIADLTSLTADVGQKSEDLEHNERALSELLSIALVSKTIVISPRSTFGYLMVGFSSAGPWSFSKTCRRAAPEPCFLIPPAFVDCSPKGDTFGDEPDHPDVHGSSTYRNGPLPIQFKNVPLGAGVKLEGMELKDAQGVLVSECPDTWWVRTQGGVPTCPYGLVVHTRDQRVQGSS